jgi:hypothetical protein
MSDCQLMISGFLDFEICADGKIAISHNPKSAIIRCLMSNVFWIRKVNQVFEALKGRYMSAPGEAR